MSDDQILNDLSNRIDFHRKWKRIWSATYFSGASASIVCAAVASASAGFITDTGEGKFITAGFALATTILTSLEKVLNLREKWDLHRNSMQSLDLIRLEFLAESDEHVGVVEQIAAVEQAYSARLGDTNKSRDDDTSGE
jgi:hypothetical protein